MFSKDLEISIANLFDKAQEINIQYLTVEHLFLMILNDYDVKDFIESHNVQIDTLKDELNEHLKKSSILRTDNQKAVQPTLGFQRVLQRAVFHIQSSGKGVVKPINLLVAIFSEKESRSVYILNKNNINRLDVVTYISHGPSDKKTSDSVAADEETNEQENIKTEENAYLINLNNLVNEDKIDNLIGRTKEIDRLIQILSRRSKNNPVQAYNLGNNNQQKLYELMQLNDPACPEPLEISEEELNYQLGQFSRHFDMKFWDNAMKIKDELSKKGINPRFAVTTKELYDHSFSFPKVRNYDYAVEQMNELEHYEDNLNNNISNSLALKRFVEVAKKVRKNLNDKYDIGFIDPGVEGDWQ